MKRESFASRMGFLLVSAGCAIGIGNVWKFPYLTGMYGGGIFVLFYLVFLVIMGVPVMTMELAIGRSSRQSIIRGYRVLQPAGSKWHLHGWVCLLANYVVMMYYATVSGWMLDYCVKFLVGDFDHIADADVAGIFDAMLANPQELTTFMTVTMLLAALVCSLGIRGGIEKITTIMITCLLILIVILSVHSITLPGAIEGVKFYLLPDIKSIHDAGLGKTVTAAMNQSFFTLSLGFGAMELFGSYMSEDYTLVNESIWICVLDTAVALIAGLIIFPACFSYGVEAGSGPSLVFVALPQVFIHMPVGWIWGTLFFLFMTFAGFSTVIAVVENIIAVCMDSFGWSRMKSSGVNFLVLVVLNIPCILGFNIWSGVRILGERGIFDSEDFLVSNLLFPIGAFVILLFCVAKRGWGFDKLLAEANKGLGVKLSPKLKPYFLFLLPALILVILIEGLL